ncbi:hypothetical protein GOBAR_AA30377 [Gossypium barbadense]|uniref:Uncharacterized protein n=1 Tax=Gossypium barbadense TaxID=3634 RepID=A0A2P5WGU8_GOSBA|nr:hypothetical protein GOBAR_AA30377 [Gossypium barbadense]
MHLVRWETVTLPKAEWGIDTPAKPKNQSLLVKLGWQFIHEKDNLWAKTLVANPFKWGIFSLSTANALALDSPPINSNNVARCQPIFLDVVAQPMPNGVLYA